MLTGDVGRVVLLGLAAAVYPQLLAIVVIILTRPYPRPLLGACYVGSLVVNVAGGILIVAAFQSRESVAGTTSHRLSPAAYLVIGGIAVVLAAVVASRRGRELMGRDLPVLRRRRGAERDHARGAAMWSRAERAISEGSVVVAAVVGMMLGVPGPFDLLAFGDLARGDSRLLVAGAAVVAFALIKFLLIEIPIVSYVFDPDGTSARVGRFAAWMKTNRLAVIAGVIALIGVIFIGQGVSRLG